MCRHLTSVSNDSSGGGPRVLSPALLVNAGNAGIITRDTTSAWLHKSWYLVPAHSRRAPRG